MRTRIRLTDKQKVDIVQGYKDLIPMIELAEKYNITRQGVYKIIKQAGVDTQKALLPVSCNVCGKEIYRNKAKIRRQLHMFCSSDCYTAFLQAGNGSPYVESRYRSRIARTIVSDHFQLQKGHIVHHENRNQTDNRLDNLRVFANQGDHVRYHRGFDVSPIWP